MSPMGKWFGDGGGGAVGDGTATRRGLAALAKGGPLAFALEPRFMFDAAGVASGGEAAADTAEIAAANHDASADEGQQAEDAALAEAFANVPPPAADLDRTEIVFIDAGVRDHRALLDGIDPAAEVVFLAADQDGMQQIADHLQGRRGIDAIHIVSHGGTGAVVLGSAVLSDATLDHYTGQLRAIGEALDADGDLLLYGCHVGAEGQGRGFITALAEVTQADVAASDDLTGAVSRGGDWALESRVGSVEADLPFSDAALDGFSGLLSAPPSDPFTSTPASYTIVGTTATGTYFSVTTSYDALSSGGALKQNSPEVPSRLGDFIISVNSDEIESFELSNLTIAEALDGNTWFMLSIFGTPADGGPSITGTITDVGGSIYHDVDLSNFAGRQISQFTIRVMGSVTDTALMDFGLIDWTGTNFVGVNTLPEVDLAGAGGDNTASFTEAGGPVHVAPSAMVDDDDSDDIASMTITVTNVLDGAAESLALDAAAAAAAAGLTVTPYNSATGVLQISGSASAAVYQTVLQGVQYENTANSPNTVDRSITVVVNDGTGDSAIRTSTVSVANVSAATTSGSGFDTTAGTHLTPGIIFGNDGEALTVADPGHLSGSTAAGGGGTDTLVLPDGSDLTTLTSLSGFETLTLDSGASVSMSEAQHDGFTTINGTGIEQITLTAADGDAAVTGDADIETYILGSTIAFTLGAGGQNVTGSTGNDMIDVGALTATGTISGGSGSDTLRLSHGADISGATVTGFENLEIASGATVTMTAAQFAQFSGTITAAGATAIAIVGDGDLVVPASIEAVTVGDAATNTRTITVQGAATNVTATAADDAVTFVLDGLTYTGTLTGHGGVADTLLVSGNTDLSGATISNVEILSLVDGASLSIDEAGHDAFATIDGAGTQQITLTSANGDANVTGAAAVETYVLGSPFSFTLGADGQNVTGSSGDDVVDVGGRTVTGTIDGGAGADTLVLADGADISGAVVSGFENLMIAANATVTMTAAQVALFSGTITATGAETIIVVGDGDFTTLVGVEAFVVGDDSTNARTITVASADVSVSATSTTDAVTFDLGSLAFVGTLTGDGTLDDAVRLADGADISGGTLSQIKALTLGTGIATMTTAQLNGFTGAVSAPGATVVALASSGTIAGVDLGAIETFRTNGGGETITLSATDAVGKTLVAGDPGTDGFIVIGAGGGQTVTGSAGADTIAGGAGDDIIAGAGGADQLTGGAGFDEFRGGAGDLNGDTIVDLEAGDTIRLTGITGLSDANVRFNGAGMLEIDTDALTFASPEVVLTLTNAPGNDLLFSVADAGGDTLITFAAVNRTPTFTDLDGGATYTENGSPVVIDGNVRVADAELDALNGGAGNYDGASIAIVRNGGANALDVFGSSRSLGTLTEGLSFTFGGIAVGTVTTNGNGTLVLTFNDKATSAVVDGVLQSITYANNSDQPCGSVTLDYTFNDGAADSAGTNQATVTITNVNDAPVLDGGATPVLDGIVEDAGDDDGSGADGDDDVTDDGNNPGTSVASLIVDGSIIDPDGAAVKAIAVTAVDNTNGRWQYSVDNGASWADFSTTTGQMVDLAGAARLLDGTLGGGATQVIRFVPDPDYNGTATITFRAWDRSMGVVGGTAATDNVGGATAFSATTNTASVTVTAVDDGPPRAPSVPDLSAGSDTGSSNTDNVTANAMPTFEGTGENGATVTLFRDVNGDGVADAGEILGTGTVTNGGWSITAASLPHGTHAIRALQTDVFGNVSAASAALAVTIGLETSTPGSDPNAGPEPIDRSGGELLVLTGDAAAPDDDLSFDDRPAGETVGLIGDDRTGGDMSIAALRADPITRFVAGTDVTSALGGSTVTPLVRPMVIGSLDGPDEFNGASDALSLIEATGGTVYIFEDGIWVGYDMRTLPARPETIGGMVETIAMPEVTDRVAVSAVGEEPTPTEAGLPVDRPTAMPSFAAQLRAAAGAFDADAVVLATALAAAQPRPAA